MPTPSRRKNSQKINVPDQYGNDVSIQVSIPPYSYGGTDTTITMPTTTLVAILDAAELLYSRINCQDTAEKIKVLENAVKELRDQVLGYSPVSPVIGG